MQWLRARIIRRGRWIHLADVRAVIGETALGVLLRRDPEVGFCPLLVLRMEVAQKRHAPPAPGPRAQAFTDKRGDGGLFAFEVAADFPEGNVETEADLIVRVHEGW